MTGMNHLKRLVRCIAALALALGLALGVGVDACAAASEPNSIGYAVRALLPENQLDESALYFDLLIAPGQQQTLQVVVMNRGEAMEVAVEANAASSNANGVIEFSRSDARDDSAANDFERMLTPVEPVIEVPAHGEAIAEFVLNAPEEPFEGTVYGGLMFTKLHQGAESEGSGSVAISNVYRYVIGVRLRQSEAEIEPEFELQGAEIGNDYGPALMLNLRNSRPLIARGIALQARVYPEGGDDAVLSFERGNIAMAPDSPMHYALYFEDGVVPLAPGAYRVAVELAFGDRTWQLDAPLNVD